MTYEFDDATHVTEDRHGEYRVEVRPGWDIRGNANGGYVMAILASALRAASGRPDPISITVHYLAPVTPSVAWIDTSIAKRGRRFTTVSGALRDDTRELARAVAAFGEVADHGSGPQIHELAPPDLPPYDECRPRTAVSDGIELGLMDRLAMRLHPDDTGFVTGELSGRSEVRGWFAFADGRPIDTLALPLACDSFPPPIFNVLGVPGWVPTVELTMHVRARPVGTRLACHFVAETAQGGTFEEDGAIWDERGVLVARSRQLGLIPFEPAV